MVSVRPETPGDESGVRLVVTAAFDTPEEARLVDALRASPAFVPDLSLVAVDDAAELPDGVGEGGDDAVVGHVMLTRVSVVRHPGVDALVLAPLAVAPEQQGRGIGSTLVRESLLRAREAGADLVVLHGSPAFYPRFGFEPAGAVGLSNPFATPPAEFMARELRSGVLDLVEGPLSYPAAFEAL